MTHKQQIRFTFQVDVLGKEHLSFLTVKTDKKRLYLKNAQDLVEGYFSNDNHKKGLKRKMLNDTIKVKSVIYKGETR